MAPLHLLAKGCPPCVPEGLRGLLWRGPLSPGLAEQRPPSPPRAVPPGPYPSSLCWARGCCSSWGLPAPSSSSSSHRHGHLVVFIHAFSLIQDGLCFVSIQLAKREEEGGSGGAPALPSLMPLGPAVVAGLPPSPQAPLTHFISRSVKMRLSRHMRSGTVRMRMKGKAREATVDMTAHSTARHTSCRLVKRCILSVRTCTGTGSHCGPAPGALPHCWPWCGRDPPPSAPPPLPRSPCAQAGCPGPHVRASGARPLADLLDVGHVRVVLGRHEQQVEALVELDPVQGGDAHVQEDPKEHGQRDLA